MKMFSVRFLHSALKKRKHQSDEVALADGMQVLDHFHGQKQDRRKTLFLKGVLVYLMVMGALGSYLSAVDVSLSWAALHVTVFLCSVFCASLYYSKRWMNVGYLLLLAAMAGAAYAFGKYINSGFYSVANDLSEQASAFFDSNAMRSYGEQIGNRSLAVTISMCYIGCVCCVLVNILISRKMNWMLTAAAAVAALSMPMYLELTPFFLYPAMLIGAGICCFILRGNEHYQLTYDDAAYQWNPRRRRLTCVCQAKAAGWVVGMVLVVCVLGMGILAVVYPDTLHRRLWGTSAAKKASMDTVENVSMLGLMGLFNLYPNTGGLTSGTLGGVNAIRYDYETDLTITFAPYTENRIYFKSFTGSQYLPYKNRWSRQTDAAGNAAAQRVDITTRRRKAQYRKGASETARGKVYVQNIAAAVGVYLPYYSTNINKTVSPGETAEYTFYPGLSQKTLGLTQKEKAQETAGWMDIPEENREAVAQLCQEAGLSAQASVEANVQRLAAYFQENIPYSYRPGATPYQEDFVNYFLKKNRRGYCAHFASAAVLAFRYIGIPARYVEGYAVDPEDISEEGTIEYEEDYKTFYDGTSELGETAVVSVNVTDANAHAWVEVFNPSLGWQVADVTPASGEEQADTGLWQRILNFLRGSSTDTGETDAQTDTQESADTADGTAVRTVEYIGIGVLVLLAAVWTGHWILRCLAGRKRFRQANWSDRLIMRYQSYLSRLSRRHEALQERKNYQDQLNWMRKHGYWRTDVVEWQEALRILEQAGFAKESLTEEEYHTVISCFVRRKRKQMDQSQR